MDQQIGNIHGLAVANEGSVQTADREVHSGGVDSISGNFTITFPEGTTGNIAFNANLASIQASIAAVIPATDVVVSGTVDALVLTYPQFARYRELPTITDVDLDGGATVDQFTRTTVGSSDPTELSATNLSGTASAQTGFSDSDMLTVASMRSRLATIDAGLYTDDYLNTLTYNDMVYAIRVNDHPETIMQ